MHYTLLKDIIPLVEAFENEQPEAYTYDVKGFSRWMNHKFDAEAVAGINWEGKEKGRSAESVINTQLVHLFRYAKTYSKSAILDSDFSTQEEFIYLITLRSFGAMGKTALIRKNIHEKPVGMKIIDRLIAQGWVVQKDSKADKRSKQIAITAKGMRVLERQMPKIRTASKIVTGNLTLNEKMTLLNLLSKLENFHYNIFQQDITGTALLDEAHKHYLSHLS